jgi:hypothetical protein
MDSVKHLNYAPKPAAAEKYLRRAYRLVIVAGLAAAIFLWAPGVIRWATVLYWQHRCLTYNAPGNHRVYECDLTTGQEIYREVNPVQAAYEELFAPGVGIGWTMPAIFLHEMRQPDGQVRLVIIDVPRFAGTKTDHGANYNLWAETLVPTAFMSQPKSSGLLVLPIDVSGDGRRIRFFEGHIDIHDPSHLTFDFEIDGQNQTCDCWLNNGGQLIVSRRP